MKASLYVELEFDDTTEALLRERAATQLELIAVALRRSERAETSGFPLATTGHWQWKDNQECERD